MFRDIRRRLGICSRRLVLRRRLKIPRGLVIWGRLLNGSANACTKPWRIGRSPVAPSNEEEQENGARDNCYASYGPTYSSANNC